MVQLCQDRGRIIILKKASFTIPEGLIEKGRITDTPALTAILRQLRKEHNWKKDYVNLCLGPQAFHLARLNLPPMRAKDLNSAMRWEMEKRFPLTAENAVFSFCPATGSSDNRSKDREYLLVAADKNIASEYTITTQNAGFKPVSLEISPFSLLRIPAFLYLDKDIQPKEHALILDIGYLNTTALITGEGKFCFYRNLRIGAKHFLQQDKNKRDTIYYKPDSEAFLNTARLLTARLNQSVDYWLEQADQTGNYPSSLLLSGGGIFIPGLPAFISKTLNIKPSLYSSVFSGGDFAKQETKLTARQNLIFTTAIGLALKGWK